MLCIQARAHTRSSNHFCKPFLQREKKKKISPTFCSIQRSNDLFMSQSPGWNFMHFETKQSAKVNVCTFKLGCRFSPSDPSALPLIHDRATAGSPEISGWVRCFQSTWDYRSLPQERRRRQTPYLLSAGPKKQAGDQVFPQRLGLFVTLFFFYQLSTEFTDVNLNTSLYRFTSVRWLRDSTVRQTIRGT